MAIQALRTAARDLDAVEPAAKHIGDGHVRTIGLETDAVGSPVPFGGLMGEPCTSEVAERAALATRLEDA